MTNWDDNQKTWSRREVLTHTAGVTLGAAAISGFASGSEPTQLKGNIQHSIVQWCFQKHWALERTCEVARQLGCKSVELVGPEHWPTLARFGLTCAIAGS